MQDQDGEEDGSRSVGAKSGGRPRVKARERAIWAAPSELNGSHPSELNGDSIVATFGSWLQEQEGREDVVGQVAHIWKGYEGNRPRVSSPKGILAFLVSQRVENIEAMMQAVVSDYHSTRGDLRIVASAPTIEGMLRAQQAQLDRIETDTRLICEVLGIDRDSGTVNQPELLEPADWNALAAVADYTEEGEQTG
jgi:hypothetical protein